VKNGIATQLPADEKAIVERVARERGISVAELTRQGVRRIIADEFMRPFYEAQSRAQEPTVTDERTAG
jgi:hypothetical protein